MVNGRLKGNRAENEVCRLLSAWLVPHPLQWRASKVEELPFRRLTTSVTPMQGWRRCGDVQHLPGIVFPFRVECKKEEGWDIEGLYTCLKWKPWRWWEQAKGQARDGYLPLLVFTRNRSPVYVMMQEKVTQCLMLQPKAGPVLTVHRPTGGRVVLAAFADICRTDRSLLESLTPPVTSATRHRRAS